LDHRLYDNLKATPRLAIQITDVNCFTVRAERRGT
jgi:hypothetical protein